MEDLQVYDCVLLASACLAPSASPAERYQAQKLLQKTLEHDPQFTLAKAYLAGLCGLRVVEVHGDEHDIRAGIRLAEEARADQRDNPLTLCMAGSAIALLGIRVMGVTLIGFRYDEVLKAVNQALAICPNLPTVAGAAAYVHQAVSEVDTGIGQFERARRLNPVGQDRSAYSAGIAVAHYPAGRYKEFPASAERAILEGPGDTSGHRAKTVTLGLLGRKAEAQEAARQVLQLLTPTLTVPRYLSVLPGKNAKLRKQAGAMLRAAGIPA